MSLYRIKTEAKGFIEITEQISQRIKESGIREGSLVVCSLDSEAGVVTASKEEAVLADIWNDLERMIPPRVDYPSGSAPYEAAARSRVALVGESLNVIIHEGHPMLGCGQAVYFVNFLGKKELEYTIAFC